jgi:hypothetical protein
MSWRLLQTEKSYNTQLNSTYILANYNKNFKTNKIELYKFLKKKGLEPVKITATNTFQKIKTKGQKKTKVAQFRPKKWYITLSKTQTLSEEIVNNFNN